LQYPPAEIARAGF